MYRTSRGKRRLTTLYAPQPSCFFREQDQFQGIRPWRRDYQSYGKPPPSSSRLQWLLVCLAETWMGRSFSFIIYESIMYRWHIQSRLDNVPVSFNGENNRGRVWPGRSTNPETAPILPPYRQMQRPSTNVSTCTGLGPAGESSFQCTLNDFGHDREGI